MVTPPGVSSFLLISLAAVSSASAFVRPSYPIALASVPKKRAVAAVVAVMSSSSSAPSTSPSASASSDLEKSRMYVPLERDAHYGGNIARYLLDLDDEVSRVRFECGVRQWWRVGVLEEDVP
jgi:hypothetical protein